MNVRELVAGEAVWIGPSETMRHAAQLMMEREVGALAVEVDDALDGIVTERDVLRACADDLDFDVAKVSECMTAYPDAFDPDMSVEHAADWLLGAGYRHLPVVEERKVIGMVSIKDILWALMDPSERGV
jgi:CBS domain-containing protein